MHNETDSPRCYLVKIHSFEGPFLTLTLTRVSFLFRKNSGDVFHSEKTRVTFSPPKILNPSNCPELHPIEIFWAIVERKLKKSIGSADTVEKLRQKGCKYANSVSKETVQKLMSDIKRKSREFIRA